MTCNPAKHNRQSIRLNGYDYSSPGDYFITICTHNRTCLFGDISDGKMILNDAGIMVEKWYFEIVNKYPGIICGDHITMPNHFHCIIKIPVATQHGMATQGHPYGGNDVRMALCGHPIRHPDMMGPQKRASIFDMMDWFKTMSTNEYIRGVKTGIWPRFEKRFWQLRYWDHIVRNENELFNVQRYIKNNPSNWERDKLNGGTGNRVLEESATYEEESWMV